MKKYIYAQFDNEEKREVSMLLYGEIGRYSGEDMINANAFAAEMFMLHEMGYKITVRINSQGGEVLAGLSIVDAVLQTESDTLIVGMAASMAGVISQAGKKRKMYDFGSLMIHAAQGGDEQLHGIVSAQLGSLLNSKSLLGSDRITKILSEDKDEWFAVQGVPDERNAMKMGLVDEVINTGKEIPLNFSQIEQKNANLYSIYAKHISRTEKTKQMEYTLLKARLKVGNSADETEMVAKVDELINRAVEPKDAKIEELEGQIEALKNEKADSLVDEAKEAGYPEESIEALKAFAKVDFPSAKNTINAFKAAKSAPVASIAATVQTPSNTKSEEVKNYKWYTNNPEAWNKLTDEEKLKIVG